MNFIRKKLSVLCIEFSFTKVHKFFNGEKLSKYIYYSIKNNIGINKNKNLCQWSDCVSILFKVLSRDRIELETLKIE